MRGDRVYKSEAEWREQLGPAAYAVTREQGTEPPFSGEFWNHKAAGVYTCRCCGLPLFASNAKFDSGSGWPSYTGPLDPANIEAHRDTSHGMVRTEVVCARCEAHLGHVFEDGPPPTGLRYCINSLSLSFTPDPEPAA